MYLIVLTTTVINSSTIEILLGGGFIASLSGTIVALVKLRSEKKSIDMITSETEIKTDLAPITVASQALDASAKAMNNVFESLTGQISRGLEERKELSKRIDKLQKVYEKSELECEERLNKLKLELKSFQERIKL